VKIWKVILATLVIFGTGVVTGGLLVGVIGRINVHPRFAPLLDHAAHATPTGPTANPDRVVLPMGTPPRRALSKEFLERLNRELKLSPEQRQQVEEILTTGQEHTKAIWEKVAPEMRAEMKETREQIRAVLSPEQNARFQELMKARPAKAKPEEAKQAPHPAEGEKP